MNFRAGLLGAGAAIAFVLAAQSASAATQECPGSGGGGTHQVEVGEPCGSQTGSASFSIVVENANGVQYTVSAEIEGGYEYAEIGEYAEVEMDIDDVMASLKSNEVHAVAWAKAAGIRSNDAKSGVTNATRRAADAKLTEPEYKALATYVLVAMQSSGGRATGRSDSATDSFTRRVDQVTQAVSRMFDAIGRNLPSLNYSSTVKKRNNAGVVVEERTVTLNIGN